MRWPCNRELLALTESHGESFHRSYALWALGLSVPGGSATWSSATELEQAEPAPAASGSTTAPATALTLEALAWIAATEGRNERAAVLLGAAGSVCGG